MVEICWIRDRDTQWRVPSRRGRSYSGSGIDVMFGVQSQQGMERQIDAVQIPLKIPSANTKGEKGSVRQFNASENRRKALLERG